MYALFYITVFCIVPKNQGPIKEPIKILHEWAIGEPLVDREQILSAEMLDLCEGHDVFWMERQHESLEIGGANGKQIIVFNLAVFVSFVFF